MADSYWVDSSGDFLVDASGNFYFCADCPCGTTGVTCDGCSTNVSGCSITIAGVLTGTCACSQLNKTFNIDVTSDPDCSGCVEQWVGACQKWTICWHIVWASGSAYIYVSVDAFSGGGISAQGAARTSPTDCVTNLTVDVAGFTGAPPYCDFSAATITASLY